MSRGHLEIAHLARLFSRLAGELGAGDGMPRPAASQAAAEAVEGQASEPIAGEDLRDLRRLLYGLHAVLRLHFAQEEETYLPLLEK